MPNERQASTANNYSPTSEHSTLAKKRRFGGEPEGCKTTRAVSYITMLQREERENGLTCAVFPVHTRSVQNKTGFYFTRRDWESRAKPTEGAA